MTRWASAYGKETCNPAARFLIHKGNKEVSDLAAAIWGLHSEEAYEKLLDLLAGAVADYVEGHPELRALPTIDMWDLRDKYEDVDDWETKKMSGKRTARRMERTGKHRGASMEALFPSP